MSKKNGYYTIWGSAEKKVKLLPGVNIVTTKRHGGYVISQAKAKKLLSEAALKRAELHSNYYYFEQDCLASIVDFELPEDVFTVQDREQWRQSVYKNLSRWNPDYLIERGYKPLKEEYEAWLQQKEDERRRNEKDPNFVVAAVGLNDVLVKVWTADNNVYIVTRESYRNVSYHKFNLSNMEVVNALLE